MAANRSSYSLLRFVPRVLVPVDMVDTSTPLLGPLTDLPIYISPTGRARMGHPGGEFNFVRAAARTGVPLCISSGASSSMEDIFEERDGTAASLGKKARIWFQLYASELQ
jgi:isopentenyl diphosphate isomerase/L-lactate dehydrogenase-like FMN-dependent dehydrogenase